VEFARSLTGKQKQVNNWRTGPPIARCQKRRNWTERDRKFAI